MDLSGLTSLYKIDCSDNQIIDLNVSGLSVLSSLWCYNNRLTSFNLSTLTNLNELWCESNSLPFSSLITGIQADVFKYFSQDTIFRPSTTILKDTILNYSSESLIDGTVTNFTFYKNGDEIESNTSGLYATTGFGKYHCTMTNAKFPGLTLITVQVNYPALVGIAGLTANNFKFYPNPVKDRLYISQPELIEQYTIYSQTGSILKQSKKYNGYIDFVDLPGGVYFLSITFNGQSGVYKVVKE